MVNYLNTIKILPYKWEMIVLLWFAFFINQVDRQIFNVVLPAIKAELNLTDSNMGLISSILILVYGMLVHLIFLQSIATGGGEAFYSPSANARISEHHDKTRATAMSIHQTALLLTLAFAGMVFVNVGFMTWMPTYLHEKFGFALARSGFDATFCHYTAAFIGVSWNI
jgi:sugar phosphate permease